MRQDYYDLKNQENKKLAAGVHVGALCRVEKFDPVAMTVDVQPLSKALDAAVYRTQPPVLGVPVALIRGAGFVVRPWYAAGDVGVILYIDHDIDRIVASGEESQPNTERNHSGDDAVFVGAFVPATKPVTGLPDEALVMGTDTGSLYIAIKKDVIEIKGDIRHIGNTQQEGRTDVTVDVTAAGVSLVKHTHNGNLGTPTSPPL
mgnify:FL=1